MGNQPRIELEEPPTWLSRVHGLAILAQRLGGSYLLQERVPIREWVRARETVVLLARLHRVEIVGEDDGSGAGEDVCVLPTVRGS